MNYIGTAMRHIGSACSTLALFIFAGCMEEPQVDGNARLEMSFQLRSTTAMNGTLRIQEAYLKLDHISISGSSGGQNTTTLNKPVPSNDPPYRLTAADSADVVVDLPFYNYDRLDIELHLFQDSHELRFPEDPIVVVPPAGEPDSGADGSGDGDPDHTNNNGGTGGQDHNDGKDSDGEVNKPGDNNEKDDDRDDDADDHDQKNDSNDGDKGSDNDESGDKDKGKDKNKNKNKNKGSDDKDKDDDDRNHHHGHDDDDDDGDDRDDDGEKKKNKGSKDDKETKDTKGNKDDKNNKGDKGNKGKKDDDDDDDDGRVDRQGSHVLDLDDFFQNAKPSLVVFATFENNATVTDVIFVVTDIERMTIPVHQNGGFAISLSRSNSAVVSFDPDLWFESVTPADMQAATLQSYQGRQVLFIHRNFNTQLYEKLIARLEGSADINIASDL